MCPWDVLEDKSGCCRIVHKKLHRLVGKLLPAVSIGTVLGHPFDLGGGVLLLRLHSTWLVILYTISMDK